MVRPEDLIHPRDAIMRAMEPGPDLGPLVGGCEGLGEPARAPELGDLLLELLDPGGGLAAERALPGRDVRIRPAGPLSHRVAGQDEAHQGRDPGPHEGANRGRAGFPEEAPCRS